MSVNAIATTTANDISGYSDDQIALIKSTIAVGATDNELKLFLAVCKNHKLDPFTRQIYFIKRSGKGTIQTSIDGFRALAGRTGEYAGNDDPVFDDEGSPKKATVTVWRMVNGVRCPFTATARWSQYYPGDAQGFMWKKMPHLMLGKVAEALALRKAFPEALSGLYSDEEMEQAETREAEQSIVVDVVAKDEPKPAIVQPATTEQMERINQLCKETKYPQKALYEYFKVESPTAETAPKMIVALEKKLSKMLDDTSAS